MRFIVLAAMLALLGSAAHAQVPTALDMATVSMTLAGAPRTVTNTICVTDGNDLVCDRGVYITSNSRVGIGTNVPNGKLEVSGTQLKMVVEKPAAQSLDSPLTGPSVDIQGGSLHLLRQSSETVFHGAAMRLYTLGNNVSTFSGRRARGTLTSPEFVASGDRLFSLTGSSISPTSYPSYLQWGVGGIDFTAAETHSSTARGVNISFYSTPRGISNAVTHMIMTADRAIGIGTLTPAASLTVAGEVQVANSGASCDPSLTGAIRYTGGDFSFCRNGSAWETLTSLAGGGGLGDRITSGTSAVVVNSATGIISISQLGAVASYVHPSLGYVGPGVSTTGRISGTSGYFSGNVGIGTPAPSAALEVSSSTNQFRLSGANGAYAKFSAFDGAGAGVDPALDIDPLGPVADTSTAHYVRFFRSVSTTAATGIYVLPANGTASANSFIGANANTYLNVLAGNVGIGKTTPAVPLDVVGQIRASDGAVDLRMQPLNASSAGIIGTFSPAHDLVLYSSGSEVIRATANKLVGIGTTSPAARLHVSGSILAQNGEITQTGLAGGYASFRAIYGNYGVMLRNDGTNFYLLQTASGDPYGPWNDMRPFGFDLASGHVFLAASPTTGVVIGAQGAPTARLDVKGTLRISAGSEACDTNRAGALRWSGSQFQVCYGSGGWALLSSAAVSGGTVTLTGDVTGSGTGSIATTIAASAVGSAEIADGAVATADLANSAVSYAKMQNVTTNNRLLGRATAGAGVVEELTIGSGLLLTGTTLSAPAPAETDPQVGSTNAGNACIGTGSAVDCGDSNVGTKDDITTRTASGFWQTNTPTTGEGWPSGIGSWAHLLTSTHSDTGNYFSMQFAGDFFNSANVFYRATNGSGAAAWYKLWHSGNDGSGSGLDADTLDGVDSSQLATTSQLGSYVAKAGDTMSGALIAPEIRIGTGADYAGAEIRSYQTGFPYIDFSLNNSEDFRMRQYVDRGDGGLRFQGADSNINFTIHPNGVLVGRNNLNLGSAVYQTDGNIYMPWLGDWLSNKFNQDVRSGANPTFGTVYTDNWYRSTNDSGWINTTYGGGWHMSDSTWLRAYNNKWIYTGGNIQADNQVRTANLCDTAGDNCSTPAAIAAAAGAATNKVSKAGDTMSGNLIVNAQVGIGTSNPQFPLDVSATSSYAIRAVTSGNAHGIYGQSLNAGQGGVIGYAANGTNFGILGHANAYSFYGNGQVYAGVTNSNPAVYGYNANNGYGVHGLSVSGIGVYGKSTNNYGVFGESATTYGVYGKSTNSAYGGILGYNYNGSVYGIVGYSGIYSFYGNGQGYFGSNLQAYAFTFTNPNQYSTSLCSYYDGSINYIGNCASLRKYKSNITDLTSGLSTVMKLRPREFDWKKGHGYGHDLGFVAEEMVEDYPLAAEYKGGTGELLGVKYEKLTALLTKAVQELKVENDNLRATVDQQKAVNDNLSRSVESLTQRLERLEAAGR